MVSLVLLRMAIGWMFFAGAWEKRYNQGFSSLAFLRQAKGPLAPLYQAELPDVHGWRQLVEQPRQQTSNPHEKKPAVGDATGDRASEEERQVKFQAFVAEPYSAWLKAIVVDWGRDQENIAGHFGFDEAQKKKAAAIQAFYAGKVKAYLEEHVNDLAGFRHDLYRLLLKKPQPELPVDSDQEARRAAALAVRGWVEQTEAEYRRELAELATDAQAIEHGGLPAPESSIRRFDRFLIYTHMAIGLCLLVGLLTRLAALGAGLFLLSVVASQPWWVAGSVPWLSSPQAVMYQVVLMLSCFVLMTTDAGRWAGLDYFFQRRGGSSNSSQQEPA